MVQNVLKNKKINAGASIVMISSFDIDCYCLGNDELLKIMAVDDTSGRNIGIYGKKGRVIS